MDERGFGKKWAVDEAARQRKLLIFKVLLGIITSHVAFHLLQISLNYIHRNRKVKKIIFTYPSFFS